MDQGLLPRRYAKALYKYAADKGDTAALYAAMQNIAAAFDANPDLQTVMANPFVSVEQKTQLLQTAAGNDADQATVADLVQLLEQNRRIALVREIALQYTAIYRRLNNIYHVGITSAAPLSETDRTRLTAMIDKHLNGATAEYEYAVDPDLIGGFTVNIDNQRLDASVRNELKQIRLSLMK